MNNSQSPSRKAAQTRFVIAISLFAAALISAITLTALGNQNKPFWVATHPLIPGSQLEKSDLESSQVALGGVSNQYLSTDLEIVGGFITQEIAAGELVALSAISETPPEMSSEQVPLSLRSADIPSDIEVGEAVNIFWVPQVMGMEKIPNPELVLSGAFLRSIDRKGSNFGSDVALTISVYSKEVISLLKATVTGRLVVVRSRD